MSMILQSPVRAEAVLQAVLRAVDDETERFQFAVAYATCEGVRLLVDRLAQQLGSRWASMPKQAVTCFDYGLTEPDALMRLHDCGFEVRIANLGSGDAIRVRPDKSAFHPKAYIAPNPAGARLVVGSANLTRRALTVNTEAISEITVVGAAAWQEPWDAIVDRSVMLYPLLLDRYRTIRPTRREDTALRDEPSAPIVTDPIRLPTLREAVERGLDPGEFAAFWVDVGYSSGGSGNQLELPRRGQRFFGYDFADYSVEHEVIGTPVLFSGQHDWECKLTWHGNNQMERLNLPTQARGGFLYRNRVVMFERAGAKFEITAADMGSYLHTRWRDESAAGESIYRVSENSPRLCGLI